MTCTPGEPCPLPKLSQFVFEDWLKYVEEGTARLAEKEAAREAKEAEARRVREAAAREVAESQAREVKEALAMEVYELDKVFPKDPDTVLYELRHGEPFEYRVKMLELALLRGGSYPYADLQAWAALPDGYAPMSKHEAETKMAYQRMALDAVLGPDGERLFTGISGSFDAPPNTNRVPATQLMFTMLQEGGLKGDNEGRVEVERWINGLPAEARGRAMYHLLDAAATRDFGGRVDITSVETPWFGIGWNVKDGWDATVRNIEAGVKGELRKNPDDFEAFKNGWKEANSSIADVTGKGGQ